MSPYRVVLADDHVMVRQGIKRILCDDPDLEVIGEASDGVEVLEFLKKSVPDMVILDVQMPRLGGLETAKEIRKLYPGVTILILTMHKEKEYLQEALAQGAQGYVLKEDVDQALLAAIAAIRQGQIFVSILFER
jgi:DNA-binding NarL/FixJ family response regulator